MLLLSNISKAFGATIALDNVSFDVRAGEVHALLGENGAGKSTLMQIAAGLLAADSGERSATGRVALVHQHFTAIPALTVGENIALAAGWRETGRKAERRAAEVIARLALPLEPAVRVEALSVQLRQRLEIVKALATDANVLLLDEPTAVLAPREVNELLTLVRGIAERGGAVVLISHKLREVLEVADRITVLRRGVITHSGPRAGETAASLSDAMIGAEGAANSERRAANGAQPAANGEPQDVRVTLGEAWLAPAVRRSPFAVRSGEVIGIAAIEGNGQRELLRGIAGVMPAPGVTVHGTVAFIPEDRTTEALIGEFTLAENLVLGTADMDRRWIDWGAVRDRTAELMATYDVRAPGPATLTVALSGGNQQKFVFARVLSGNPDVIVAEDPTRGLDVAATAAIHARLRAAADAGACVIVHSSDLDEVLLLADRLLVMADRHLVELPRDTPREVVGDAMLGITPAAPA
jgi:simple sugar transport system ATP-binding protein